jgi:integrase
MLLKRKNTYYFRWQTPKDLRPHFGYELIRSLRTTNKIEALARMGSYAHIVSLIKETRRLMLLKELTQENYLSVIESIRLSLENESMTLGKYAQVLSLPISLDRELDIEILYRHLYIAELNGISLDQLITKKDPVQAGLPATSRSLSFTRGHLRITKELIKQSLSKEKVVEVMRSQGYESQDDLIIAKFRRDYAAGLIAQQDRKIDLMTGRTPVIEAYKRATPQVLIEKEQAPVITLSSFIKDEFFEYKKATFKGLTKKSEKDYNTDFAKILAVIDDKPLNLYVRKDIQKCLKDVAGLPVKNKRPYTKMSYAEILKLGDIPENALVSHSTVDHVKKSLQGIFNTAIALDLISKSPANMLDWKVPKTGFSNYENIEVKTLFDAAQKEQGWKKWLVPIAALSGCRLSEIIHLRGKDLIKDANAGIYYFDITTEAGDLKTDAASRKVPIHSKLIELGLLEYRDGIGADVLFDVKDKAVTAWFARFRKRCGVPHLNEKKDRKVFHSFRHWVITRARAKVGNLDLVQQVVGHEKTSAGATDRYTDEMPMIELQRVIECLDFN